MPEHVPPAASSGPESSFGPLQHPVFRMLWLTWLAANTTMWMNDVAAAWLMTSLSPSPLWVALVQSASTLPVFLLGHSAGGVVSCIYTLDKQAELAGLICESFAFEVPAPDFALAAIKALSHVAPRLPVLKLKNEDFSRNPQAVLALNSDPLTAGEVQPAQTVAALVRADERLEKEFPRMTLPVLIMHGTVDKATLARGSQFFFDTVGSADKTLKLYEGHFHDLFNDFGREGVMADTQRWIERQLAG